MKNQVNVKSTNAKIFTIITIIIITLSLMLASCGGQPAAPDTTPSPSPEPSTPPPSSLKIPVPTSGKGWVADGVINAEEYHNHTTFDNGNYELHWDVEGDNIFIGMKAKTTGWLAIGFPPGDNMKDADIILCYIQDKLPFIRDMYSTGEFGPHPPDPDLGGLIDIFVNMGIEADGFTTVEFRRPLVTGDKYDAALQPGPVKIMWAYGPDDDQEMKHTARGFAEINL